jgi:hypothetical protein
MMHRTSSTVFGHSVVEDSWAAEVPKNSVIKKRKNFGSTFKQAKQQRLISTLLPPWHMWLFVVYP